MNSNPNNPSRRRVLAVLLSCAVAPAPFAIGAPTKPAAGTPPRGVSNEQLAALADEYYETNARLNPLAATFGGDNRFDSELTVTIAPQARKDFFDFHRGMLARLQTIDRKTLSPADAVTRDYLDYELRSTLEQERFDDHLLPISHGGGVPVELANFASGQGAQPLTSVEQYDAYLKRISHLPAWTAQAIANMREGIRRGIVQPKAIIVSTLPKMHMLVTEPIEQNVFYTPIKNLPASFPEADRARLTTAYRDTIANTLLPALRELAAFMEKEYLPAGRATSGYGALPNGAEWYRAKVREQTTTDLSPDEIHALGLKEVARIRKEIDKVLAQLGYRGDMPGLQAWVDAQPRFHPFKSEADILDTYRALNARIDPGLKKLFGRTPKAGLEIEPEPPLTRATASDHYQMPPQDGSRPGVFWTVVEDPRKYDLFTMTSLFLHEGRPGHHFQLALQQELPLPKFRKTEGPNAYVEGWGLYAETLGRELGLYDDPVAWLGHLQMELLRAVRLVVDTGLHAKGWTREQTMRYMIETQGITEASARRSTERYMAWPGQALGYKIGALRIQALRRRAQAALGKRFKLSGFHDAVLSDGALPLPLLDAKIERWIAAQRA